jgi:enamine deaminase RidA (YjgF/YER057c/UK114 family)
MLAPGGWGEKSLRDYNYSMVMEVGGRVELSGQGGWDPITLEFPAGHSIEVEIDQAFDNVAFMLNAVGVDWRNVGHVNSYHVPEPDGTISAATAEMGRQFRLRMPTTNLYGPALASRSWAIRKCVSKFARPPSGTISKPSTASAWASRSTAVAMVAQVHLR